MKHSDTQYTFTSDRATYLVTFIPIDEIPYHTVIVQTEAKVFHNQAHRITEPTKELALMFLEDATGDYLS